MFSIMLVHANERRNSSGSPSRMTVSISSMAGFYGKWYPSKYLGWGEWPRFSSFGPLAGHVRFMEYPLDLVVAQPTDEGFRYVIVTARQIKYEETVDESHAGSLDYPFGILVFDSGGIHATTGMLFTRGALSISDEGRPQASQYDGEPGTLKDVKRVDSIRR